MSEFPTRFESPEAAYRGFFRADNAKNPPGWAACMSYPHVRVSATGSMVRYETPQQYADAADWTSREATGWVRSEGIEPERIQESDSKVHLAGGWTRFNAQNQPILENRVTYILTRIEDSWGIQARLGIDSFTDGVVDETEREATAVVEDFVAQLGKNQVDACAKLCRYPLTVVRIGDVITASEEHQVADLLASYVGQHVRAQKIKAVQTRDRAAVVQVETQLQNGSIEQGVVLVAKVADNWRIAATSHIGR